jgi:hypothetical protein
MVKEISSESKNLSYRVYSDESYLETGMEDASSHLCGRFFGTYFMELLINKITMKKIIIVAIFVGSILITNQAFASTILENNKVIGTQITPTTTKAILPYISEKYQGGMLDSIDERVASAMEALQAQINALKNQNVTVAPITPTLNLNSQSQQDQIQTLTQRVYALEQQNIQLKAQIAGHEKRVGIIETFMAKAKKLLKL